jgi:protein O-mannosyl-transferase
MQTDTSAPLLETEAQRLPLRLLLIPFLLALAAFASTWASGFVYDDIELIETNPAMSEWATIGRGFQEPFWSLAPFQQNYAGYYRPVSATAFVILHKLSGGKPWSFHLASTLIHALSALLVVCLAMRIGLKRGAGVLAGVAFALSGAHVEAVAWASALPDLLATCFSLLALTAFARGRLLWALPALLLAMLSKESAYATWLVLFGIAVLGSRQLPLARRLISLPSFLVIGSLVYGLRVLAFDDAAAGFDMQLTFAQLEPSHEHALSRSLIARYLFFLIAPLSSRPFRALRLDETADDLAPLAILGAWLSTVALVFWLFRGRRSPLVLVGFALLFGGLAPVLNTQAIGRFPFEERFTYLPSAGFALLFGGMLFHLAKRGPHSRKSSAGAGVALALSLAWAAVNIPTLVRVIPRWSDHEGFARWATEVSPETMTPWILAGQATLQRAQGLPQNSEERAIVAEEAFELFERSLEIHVDEVLVAGHERETGNVGLGDALFVSGDINVAQQVYEETLKGFPYSQAAHLGLSTVLLVKADAANQRSARLQDPEQRALARAEILELAETARVHADQATRGSRELGAFHHNRSVANYWIGMIRDKRVLETAEADARRSIELDPTNYQFVLHLAEVQYIRERLPEMLATLEAYLAAAPNTPHRVEVEASIAALRGQG